MRRFSLATLWHLEAPIQPVWDALVAVDQWPAWWRFVQSVQELEPGDVNGLGALRRYTWSSRLPYRLTFVMRVTQVTPPVALEGVADGDLTGSGRWQLAPSGETTRVRYDWNVAATKPWMQHLAPLFAPLFRWNHHQVMAEGGRGLARHLGVRLLAFDVIATGPDP